MAVRYLPVCSFLLCAASWFSNCTQKRVQWDWYIEKWLEGSSSCPTNLLWYPTKKHIYVYIYMSSKVPIPSCGKWHTTDLIWFGHVYFSFSGIPGQWGSPWNTWTQKKNMWFEPLEPLVSWWNCPFLQFRDGSVHLETNSTYPGPGEDILVGPPLWDVTLWGSYSMPWTYYTHQENTQQKHLRYCYKWLEKDYTYLKHPANISKKHTLPRPICI